MISCFVRALRSRRPSIREELEAIAEDKDLESGQSVAIRANGLD